MDRRFPRDLVGVLLLLHALPAAAYIDPGTGSALFYVVSGIVASAYFLVRGAYYRAIDLALGLRHRDQRCGLAIHCEDARYESTFLPVLGYLAGRSADITLFTMYERDATFQQLPQGVTHKVIPPGLLGYAYLNNIEAVVLATTTPQLDVMTFRRSRRVSHYAILQHALGECRYVRPYAYDYYDSVLCCGPVVMANIRRMESIRGSTRKELLETGLPHYEPLLEHARSIRLLGQDPVVLVAPSWGPLSMFEAFGIDFVSSIAARYRVIVRPHPQMKASQPELYARILAIPGVEVNTDRTPAAAMSRAHVLLSDISGITQEFAFIHERPVLVIDRAHSLGGLEGEVLGGDSELKQLCREFIVPLDPEEMPRIADHIHRVLSDHSSVRIAKARDDLVFNFGRAAEVAAEQLYTIFLRESAGRSSPTAPDRMVTIGKALP